MKLFRCVNLLENKKLIRKLNIFSIPLLILFLFLFYLLTLWDNSSGDRGTASLGTFVFIFSLGAMIIIHELIHGLFFKMFNTKGKIKFGFKNGLAYVTSPNSFILRRNFLSS